MNWDSFVNSLADALAERQMLKEGASWVLGISGGPDSTVLAHAMAELNGRRGLRWGLHAAHLHHSLRGEEADQDAEFVRQLADRLGLTYHFEQIDVRRQVSEGGGSTEEVARERRYDFLERVAFKTGSDFVAVGHHADDNAETIIHRACRGTGIRGLAGMSITRAIRDGSRITLVRPLLGVRRAQIESIAKDRNFEWRNDSTNLSPEFTRGRIRSQIMPMLRDVLNPNVVEALLRLAEQARWMSQYLADAGERTFDSMVVSQAPQRIVLNKYALLSKPRIIQAEVIRRAASIAIGREQDLGFNHIEAVMRLAEDPRSGKEVHLPGPVLVQRLYGRIDFRPLDARDSEPALDTTQVHCPGETILPPPIGMELAIDVRAVDADTVAELRQKQSNFEEWLDYDSLRLPLIVRGRRDGDRFHPLGAPGAKSLSDFFIGEKIEPELRARTGVLCDQTGPIWVMPLRIDDRVKLTDRSRRALRLRLRPGKDGRPEARGDLGAGSR